MSEREDFFAGDIVRHFKAELNSKADYLYKIICFAQSTENEEVLVIYQALYGEKTIWARPYNEFLSKVDKKKYPNVQQTYRFEKIKEVL